MARSINQSVELTCASCGQPFSSDVWLIVDAVERPDLVERIDAETIHIAACPHCGTAHPLDAPLLYHNGPEQTLIFASQEHSSAEQDQAIARELGQRLISSIPVEERATYLTTARTVIGIDGLRRALAGEEPLETDTLSAALQTLMEATTPEEVRASAAAHPLLNTPDAQEQLRSYVQQLRAGGHTDLAQALEQRIEVLAINQPNPTLQFIQALLDADSPEQRHAIFASRPHDVTPEVPTILEALADQAQRRHLEAVARDMLVIRDEVLGSLGRDVPVTPSA